MRQSVYHTPTTTPLAPEVQACQIEVSGIVQGVGFRPWVYRQATLLGLCGSVYNNPHGVVIWLEGRALQLDAFVSQLQHQPPPAAHITHWKQQAKEPKGLTDFQIEASQSSESPALLLTPDLVTCSACRTELLDPTNRRFRYPFISCVDCGPRYSIIAGLPYDRAQTTMHDFPLCTTCAAEYSQPSDRRFHAQSTACGDCGPQLTRFINGKWELTPSESLIKDILLTFQKGGIVAVKGLTGFLLLADATQTKAIEELRRRKHRPQKPLAILVATLEIAKQYVRIDEDAARWLNHPGGPIVVLEALSNTNLATESLAPQLTTIGLQLPATPLLQLIALDFGKPLVATSANISGCPVIYTAQDAAEHLAPLADLLCGDNRPILHPQDDSVLMLTRQHRVPIWFRHGRGLSPSIPGLNLPSTGQSVLATGALLKSSIARQLSQGPVFMSQFLGNTDVYEAQLTYRKLEAHWNNLFQQSIDVILADKHPQYFAHQFSEELSEKTGAPVHTIQHHEAHAMALLAEHQRLSTTTPVLCFVWDGTGLGNDGQIWGSECFVYQTQQLNRLGHWPGIPVLAGDRMAKDTRLSWLSAWHHYQLPLDALWSQMGTSEHSVYHTLVQQPSTVKTHSAGRMFDAVAARLGIALSNAFEGRAGMLLESAGYHAYQPAHLPNPYPITIDENGIWQLRNVCEGIEADLAIGIPASQIALRFHVTLAYQIWQYSRGLHINTIGCSGGVFQNSLLVDLLLVLKEPHETLLLHQDLPPNDESISLGQLAHYQTLTI